MLFFQCFCGARGGVGWGMLHCRYVYKKKSFRHWLPMGSRQSGIFTYIEITIKIQLNVGEYMDVSENSGTPKSSILIGFSIINLSFWGTTIFGNTQYTIPMGYIYIYKGIYKGYTPKTKALFQREKKHQQIARWRQEFQWRSSPLPWERTGGKTSRKPTWKYLRFHQIMIDSKKSPTVGPTEPTDPKKTWVFDSSIVTFL